VTPADFPALREVKLFRTMGPNDRAAVDSLLKARALRAGGTLFIAGEPGDSMLRRWPSSRAWPVKSR
jgi:hypothetical protein